MPFRIASTNVSHRVFHSLFAAEMIRALKPEFDGKTENEKEAMAREIAQKKFCEKMSSAEERYNCGLMILHDLHHLLDEEEMWRAARELMRQSEVLAWGTLEVLTNDLVVRLVNARPQMTEALAKDERTKKRFQLKEIGSSLPTYGYDLSKHMDNVLAASMKIDDVETMRDVYDVIMPTNEALRGVLRDAELWKLNQRRNLILHRRSIVDDAFLRNTGDSLNLGTELIVTPEQLKKDLILVLHIGSAMLIGLTAVA
jgi:hypothetical protein